MNVFPRKSSLPLAVSILVVLSVSAFADDPASHEHTTSAVTDETPFLKENDAAMAKMMSDMAVKPTGDVSRDFVEMMIPHHQGAIDMAQAYLRYGSNEQLKRIAQEIIVDQQQEIAAMRLALSKIGPYIRRTQQLTVDAQRPVMREPRSRMSPW